MQNLWIQQMLEYAETDIHKKRVSVSKQVIQEAIEKTSNPYVSISGGKDSTVVHALCPPDIRRIHHDDEFCLSVTNQYLKSISHLIILKTEAKHTDWFVTNKGENDLSKLDFDCCFLGLRAQENSYRRKHLANYGLIYESKGKIFCNPISWWKIEDVWAFLLSNEIPYNAAYDIMHENGVSPDRQRIGPFANDRAVGYGQLQILKKCFPSDFNRFCSKYPKARAYV